MVSESRARSYHMARKRALGLRWRRPRLSVRALMVLVLCTGAGVGWIVRSARVQRGAVSVIQAEGGSVMYDWELRDGEYHPGLGPWCPRWLIEQLGVDSLCNAVRVDLVK